MIKYKHGGITMEKLKCTSCGGHLDVEENKEYAVCKHCGARYKLNEDININIKVNDREEYKLSDKKYKKIKKVLTIIGIASLCIGILLFIISFLVDVPAMGNPGWFDAESKKDMMRFLAFIFGIMIPLPVFSFAYGREIEAYNNK
jgi:DNA-directed RNA polymerase subunit M/transcription elongation factor TFIIS